MKHQICFLLHFVICMNRSSGNLDLSGKGAYGKKTIRPKEGIVSYLTPIYMMTGPSTPYLNVNSVKLGSSIAKCNMNLEAIIILCFITA